jgi:hypothetical protein
MGCNTKMEVSVQRGFHYKTVTVRCGNTDPNGDEYRCESCSQRRPWYLCRHGNDVSEYCCGQCEGEGG